MIKALTFRQLLFILPLLAILAVFSVYPILSSFAYTFFDFRPTDPTRASLNVRDGFVSWRFHRDALSMADFVLEQEAGEAPNEEAYAEIREVQALIRDFAAPFEGEDTRGISRAEHDEIYSFLHEMEGRIAALYDAYPDADFWHREFLPVRFGALRDNFFESNFVGLGNYGELARDSRFWSALRVTLIFTAISVFLELVLGMAMALIMNQAIKGIGGIRTVALIPWAIPTAVAALMWGFLYDGSNGVVAHIFSVMGIIEAPTVMLVSTWGAMASAILADVWKTTPYMALLLLAGLQTIDSGLYESASIDGSGRVGTFAKITLPLMKSSILVALLFRMLDAFRVFDLIFVLTGGGPGNATETLSIYAHRLMIQQQNFGYGSTVVIAMFLCVAAIAFIFVKVLGAEIFKSE